MTFNDNLYTLYNNAMRIRYDNPRAAQMMLMQGYEQAKALQDHYWIINFSHWALQVMVFNSGDYTSAYDLAIESAIEARKPVYAEFQERICIHEDLINVYMGRDPQGKREMIQQAIDYMEGEVEPNIQCYHCLNGLRTGFYSVIEDYDRAYEAAMHYLAETDKAGFSRTHHRIGALYELCVIAFKQGDIAQLKTFAEQGEALARNSRSQKEERITFVAWQCYVHYQHGDAEQATSAYRRATSGAARLNTSLGEGYYMALTAYLVARNSHDRALKLLDKQLEHLINSGQPYNEIKCRMQRAKLQHHLGCLTAEDIHDARMVAKQLARPETYLKELSTLENDLTA